MANPILASGDHVLFHGDDGNMHRGIVITFMKSLQWVHIDAEDGECWELPAEKVFTNLQPGIYKLPSPWAKPIPLFEFDF